ncbi:MAG: LysR family transcriptional regulator [Sandaracinaceae bacterium]
MNYNHLRYFWAVAHEGNLTRAARKLHVSQSAVSVQIQKLEEELGHALFERRGNKLILTEAGRLVVDHADAIFDIGDELLSTLRHQGDARTPVLRVGALATLSRNFQLGFLAPVLADPEVEVLVRSGTMPDLLRLLEAHRIDVVLANVSPPRDARTPWVAHAIGDQPVSLVARPEIRRRGRTLEELLSGEPLVVPTVETGIRAGFDALVARLGIRPRLVAQVDDMAMLRLVAREHRGLSLVPPVVVKDELESGKLVEIEVLAGLRETFFAVTLERRFPNPVLRRLPMGLAEESD